MCDWFGSGLWRAGRYPGSRARPMLEAAAEQAPLIGQSYELSQHAQDVGSFAVNVREKDGERCCSSRHPCCFRRLDVGDAAGVQLVQDQAQPRDLGIPR